MTALNTTCALKWHQIETKLIIWPWKSYSPKERLICMRFSVVSLWYSLYRASCSCFWSYLVDQTRSCYPFCKDGPQNYKQVYYLLVIVFFLLFYDYILEESTSSLVVWVVIYYWQISLLSQDNSQYDAQLFPVSSDVFTL